MAIQPIVHASLKVNKSIAILKAAEEGNYGVLGVVSVCAFLV
jgi:hypothetical protein